MVQDWRLSGTEEHIFYRIFHIIEQSLCFFFFGRRGGPRPYSISCTWLSLGLLGLLAYPFGGGLYGEYWDWPGLFRGGWPRWPRFGGGGFSRRLSRRFCLCLKSNKWLFREFHWKYYLLWSISAKTTSGRFWYTPGFIRRVTWPPSAATDSESRIDSKLIALKKCSVSTEVSVNISVDSGHNFATYRLGFTCVLGDLNSPKDSTDSPSSE